MISHRFFFVFFQCCSGMFGLGIRFRKDVHTDVLVFFVKVFGSHACWIKTPTLPHTQDASVYVSGWGWMAVELQLRHGAPPADLPTCHPAHTDAWTEACVRALICCVRTKGCQAQRLVCVTVDGVWWHTLPHWWIVHSVPDLHTGLDRPNLKLHEINV